MKKIFTLINVHKKMKKNVIAACCILLWFLGISFGVNIGDVSLRFCNTSGTLEKTLALNISGQETKDICMILGNNGKENASVTLSFVDGTITNDTDQKKACKNEGENQNFGKYVTLEKNTIVIPSKGTTTITGKLLLPEETVGEVHGCVTYFAGEGKNKNEMFTIMVRRANFIDAFVKWVVTVGVKFIDLSQQENNLSKNPKIISTYDTKENKLFLQASIQNKGTAEAKIHIKGIIKNRLGYSKTFMEETRTVFWKETTNLSSTIENLPFYKGPFTITYELEYNAVLQNGLETNNQAESTGKLTEKTNIMIISVGTYILAALIVGIVGILSIVTIFHKKHHKEKWKTYHRKHSNKK